MKKIIAVIFLSSFLGFATNGLANNIISCPDTIVCKTNDVASCGNWSSPWTTPYGEGQIQGILKLYYVLSMTSFNNGKCFYAKDPSNPSVDNFSIMSPYNSLTPNTDKSKFPENLWLPYENDYYASNYVVGLQGRLASFSTTS